MRLLLYELHCPSVVLRVVVVNVMPHVTTWGRFLPQRSHRRILKISLVIAGVRDSLDRIRTIFMVQRVAIGIVKAAVFVPRHATESAICKLLEGASREPQRINPLHRIRRILIDVDSTRQPNRILANKPPSGRIIIPIPIVMRPRLFIDELPLEPQRILHCLAAAHSRRTLDHFRRFAPGLIRRFPHHLAGFIRHHQRRANLIAVIEHHARIDIRYRHTL